MAKEFCSVIRSMASRFESAYYKNKTKEKEQTKNKNKAKKKKPKKNEGT